MKRSLLTLVACVALGSLACDKSDDGETRKYEPPPRKATSRSALRSLCDGGKPFDGNPKYEKKSDPAKPSKVAVFRKYLDDEKPAFKRDEHDFGAIGADGTNPAGVELVACVELKRKGEPLFCNYHGATIKIFDMTHDVKVVEVATGKVVGEHEFELDRRTEKCSATATGSGYRGTDYSHKLLSLLLPLEPKGVELPEIETADLDAVCSGSAFPQAAPLANKGPRPMHTVYFPTEERSFTREDLPEGLVHTELKDLDASEVQLVACVTGKPKTKKKPCSFTTGKVLELHDGDLEVAVHEARTGKVVEKKTFAGTAGDCPVSYEFFGKVDKIVGKIDPAFGAYVKKLQNP